MQSYVLQVGKDPWIDKTKTVLIASQQNSLIMVMRGEVLLEKSR